MVVDRAKIERLEKELEEARRELLKEDGERYRILMRELPETDREKIIGSLTDKKERVLFGLEPPEEEKRGRAMRAGSNGGDLTCDICGKGGFTKRGLALHVIRMHKSESERKEEKAA